jgi:hypothetical protein
VSAIEAHTSSRTRGRRRTTRAPVDRPVEPERHRGCRRRSRQRVPRRQSAAVRTRTSPRPGFPTAREARETSHMRTAAGFRSSTAGAAGGAAHAPWAAPNSMTFPGTRTALRTARRKTCSRDTVKSMMGRCARARVLTTRRGSKGPSPRPSNVAFVGTSGSGHRAHGDSYSLRPR